MKRKALLFVLTVSALVCMLALSVSAAEWFGTVEIIDNNGDGVSDISVTDCVPNVVTEGDLTSESARVKINCDCANGSHTFPAYYVCVINPNVNYKCYNLGYTRLNALKADYCGGTAAYTLNDVVAFELPAGYTDADAAMVKKAASLKYFSFAKCSTATMVGDAYGGNNWLEATPVVEVDFGSYLTKIPSFFCYNCDSLTKVTIPDQITIVGAYAFNGCDSLAEVEISKNSQITSFEGQCFKACKELGAFYIPSKVTSFGVNGSGNSPIDGCTKLYFVNDPDETEKPSVYRFPSTVKAIVGETFKNCTSLNDVIVFHEEITSVDNGWAFCGSNAVKVVFLGDMEKVSTTGNAWNKGIEIYFCNENDKSADSLTMNTSASKVFCKAEGNTTHLKEKSLSTDATCEVPKMVADYCFCGAIMGTPQTDGDALGHNYTGNVSYAFTTVTANGEKCTACVNNCGIDLVESVEPVYVELGYSANTVEFAITNGYKVNRESLALYEKEKGVNVKLGFAFNSAADFTDGEVTVDSFKLKAEVSNQLNGVAYSYLGINLFFANDEHINDNIIVGVYVVERSEEGDTVYFVNRTYEDGVNGFETVSYNSLLNK